MNSSKKRSEVVTVTALSLHLDVSREQITRLEKQGVIDRLPSGNFDQDECRVRYLRHLRERSRPAATTATDTRKRRCCVRSARLH